MVCNDMLKMLKVLNGDAVKVLGTKCCTHSAKNNIVIVPHTHTHCMYIVFFKVLRRAETLLKLKKDVSANAACSAHQSVISTLTAATVLCHFSTGMCSDACVLRLRHRTT